MRAPIGFVVEGVCEYQCFETFVRKGVIAAHGRIPIVNAWGNGGLRKRLEEHLAEVAKVNHPVVVIVALDKKDALDEGAYADCSQLRLELQSRADRWLESVQGNDKLSPVPERIVVVVQTPVFEAWLTADPVGLVPHMGKKPTLHCFENVDAEIAVHRRWLDDQLAQGFSKSPVHVHRLAKSLHPVRMARRSRSFAKFWKEVVAAYHAWELATGSAYSLQEE